MLAYFTTYHKLNNTSLWLQIKLHRFSKYSFQTTYLYVDLYYRYFKLFYSIQNATREKFFIHKMHKPIMNK